MALIRSSSAFYVDCLRTGWPVTKDTSASGHFAGQPEFVVIGGAEKFSGRTRRDGYPFEFFGLAAISSTETLPSADSDMLIKMEE